MSGKIRRAVSTAADRARNRLGIDEQPDYLGATTRDAAKGAKITHPAQQDEVASEFDETLYYGDPDKDIPEEMSGVVQIKTPSQEATERALALAIEDPSLVLDAPMVQQDASSMDETDARFARRSISEHHRGAQERLARLKDTLGSVEGAGTVGEWGPGGIVIGGDPDRYPDLSRVTGSLDEEIARAKAFDERALPDDALKDRLPTADQIEADRAERREALARFEAEQADPGRKVYRSAEEMFADLEGDQGRVLDGEHQQGSDD